MFIKVPNKANSRLSSAGGPLFSGWGEGFPSVLLSGTAWYRSDRLITLNGSTVSAWGDLTGNGNTATQATEANQPTYTQSAINGKPGLTFDGTLDHLRADGVASVFTGTDVPWALAFLIDLPSAQSTTLFGVGRNGSANEFIEVAVRDTGVYRFLIQDSAGTLKFVDSSAISTGVHAMVLNSNGTALDWWLNGSKIIDGGDIDVGAITTDVAAIASRIREGTAGDFLDGVVAESFVTDSTLTSDEVTTIGEYLATRGGVTW